MRSSKRVLAGVAAGALGLGLVSFVGATGAEAAKVKPKASAVAITSPVRATGTSSPLSIPAATIGWTGTGTLSSSTVALSTAPTATAILSFGATSSGDDTVTLSQSGTLSAAHVGTDDTSIKINVDTAGYYAGSIVNGSDAVSFSFTTRNAPASMTITPASQTVLQGADANLVVTLKDAAGNVTQPQTVDTVAVSVAGDDTVVTGALLTGADLALGVAPVVVETANTANTSTVTATPQGTLPGSGVTAASATVTTSGSVSSVRAKTIKVVAPTKHVSLPPNTDDTVNRIVAVPVGTSSVNFLVDDTTANPAGQQLRFELSVSAGTATVGGQTATATTPAIFDVTTDGTRQAAFAATLSGAALAPMASVTLKQVDLNNAPISAGTGIVATQIPAAAEMTISPDDSILAALGTTTNVAVTITDQYGNPIPGYTITAFRGPVSSVVVLSQGVTNSSGVATVGVTNAAGLASGQSENYSFTATPPGVNVPSITENNTLTIAYTTDGKVATMSVAVSGTGTSQPSLVTPDDTVAPIAWVPDDTAGVPYGTSAGAVTLATGETATAASGNLVTLATTVTPTNSVTYTVPTGLYVKLGAPPSAWNDGTTTVIAANGGTVYVWGTKVGTHDVTITSGGQTLTAKVKIVNRAQDAYNISVTPESATVDTGSFSTVTATATDYWGNPVEGAPLLASATGQILLAGFNTTQAVLTGASGTATVTVVAGSAAGTGTVAVIPNPLLNVIPAWQAIYTKPATFTSAPVTSDAATITVQAPASQSIVIAGARATVNGKSGIKVDGTTEGFEMGAIVNPYIKFPGETAYTKGIDKLVDEAGEFSWQRKTGKKAYVYFKSADGSVKSNTIIIPAA